jgi:hypothetical protein
LIVIDDQSGRAHGLDCSTVHNDAGLTPAKIQHAKACSSATEFDIQIGLLFAYKKT